MHLNDKKGRHNLPEINIISLVGGIQFSSCFAIKQIIPILAVIMHIRKATPNDLDAITGLFFDTVQQVNSKDYDPEQIDIWAYASLNRKKWLEKINSQYFLVAESEGKILGFGSIEPSGYLDLMYIHKDYQRQGVALVILHELEAESRRNGNFMITTEASITAIPFCIKNGFEHVKKQYHEVDGIRIMNYKMVKHLR